jgi:glycine oxidase
VAGLIIATGFFRHGVLLTPAAAAICRQLMDWTDPRWALPAGPVFTPGLRPAPPLLSPVPGVTANTAPQRAALSHVNLTQKEPV